jgi:hypothetical protein
MRIVTTPPAGSERVEALEPAPVGEAVGVDGELPVHPAAPIETAASRPARALLCSLINDPLE